MYTFSNIRANKIDLKKLISLAGSRVYFCILYQKWFTLNVMFMSLIFKSGTVFKRIFVLTKEKWQLCMNTCEYKYGCNDIV